MRALAYLIVAAALGVALLGLATAVMAQNPAQPRQDAAQRAPSPVAEAAERDALRARPRSVRPDGPPIDRDCARWDEAAAASAGRRVAARADEPPGAYADRAQNPDPALAMPLKRPVSVDVLYCEQLNLHDKLDYLIRRASR